MASCPRVSSCVHLTVSAPVRTTCDGSPMTVRGGGVPHVRMASIAVVQGLARSGNARVRRGMIQLAWRFLDYQKDSALAKWFEARTKNGSRKKMIVALARKLLIAL